MLLRELIAGVAPERAPGLPPVEVTGLARDSRRAGPGEVFVAVPGRRVDGAAFAADAVARGAAAVVAERDLPGLGAPVVVVPDAAAALGRLADRLAGRPSRDVRVTGVTGTNGKTTTSFLTAWILEATGRDASLLGTVENRVGGRVRPAAMTTPDALEVHAALASTRDAGLGHLVMEVSSHALDQRRTAGVRFAGAVFTNLTRDHMDYHGSLAAYGAAKARLFEGLDAGAFCVLNARDPFSADLAARTRARVVTYAWVRDVRPAGADVAARVLAEDVDGTRLLLCLGGRTLPVNLPLVGAFNVENALAAAAAAWCHGVAPGEVRDALEASQGVPGRLEPVPDTAGGGPAVLVDYAHTPDALERVLETLRPLVSGRLVVVFGCGGDRDRGKRAPMGAAVERRADLSVVTSDNPRGEAPERILRDVLAGLRAPERALVIADRRAAIRAAIEAAGPGDLVLLAGKGHETGQRVGGRTLPFDDRVEAAAALGGRRRRAA